jgi:hypothetical protein
MSPFALQPGHEPPFGGSGRPLPADDILAGTRRQGIAGRTLKRESARGPGAGSSPQP